MPLCMVSDGESFLIKKIMGKEEVRRFLENLGFVAGAQVSLVSKIGGNVIVQVKESRVAIKQRNGSENYCLDKYSHAEPSWLGCSEMDKA